MSLKVIRQKDAMQCGVACLAMICRHFGAEYSLEFLDRYCHATTEGVSMKGIKDAAERLGLVVERQSIFFVYMISVSENIIYLCNCLISLHENDLSI